MTYLIKIDDEARNNTSRFEIEGLRDCINIFLVADEEEIYTNVYHYQLNPEHVDDFIKALERAKEDYKLKKERYETEENKN